MKQKTHTLHFSGKVTPFEKLNDRFLKAKCYVLALGKNANKSYLAEENVNNAYHTMAGIPVVGHLMEDENGNYYLGGHDYKLDMKKSGFKLKSQCTPFGFVYTNQEPVYEDVVEENGDVHKYLTCEIILWLGRFPELESIVYDEETICGQSMEIIYDKSEPLDEDNSYTNITNFSFDALCMLNKSDDPKFNVTPCFPNASIKAFSSEESRLEFSATMEEMQKELQQFFAKCNEVQGGTSLMDEKLTVLEKYQKTVEDLDFSIDDLSVDELSEKMEELFGEKTKEPEMFSATYREKLGALEKAVNGLCSVEKDEDGNYVKEVYVYLNDFSDEYAFVQMSIWSKESDFESKVGRIAYETSEDTVTLGEFEEMVVEWLTLGEKATIDEQRGDYEKITTEFEEYKASFSVSTEEFEKLVKFKELKETEDKETLLAQYEATIGSKDEYAELKENLAEYSLDELKKECIYIVGLYTDVQNQETKKVETKPLNFSVEEQALSTENLPYGGIIEKYRNK